MKVYQGTELKLNIGIEPVGGLTMDEYDFTVEVYCFQNKAIKYSKADAIRVDANNYMVLVDTTSTGVGELKCKVTAQIPDGDFKDGIRTEIEMVSTNITIVK